MNGYLHRISPTSDFADLPPGATLQVDFEAELWMLSRSDVLPNWYVVEPGCPSSSSPLVISSTAGFQRSFVRPFTKPVQWKQSAADTYNPLSPGDRYITVTRTAIHAYFTLLQ